MPVEFTAQAEPIPGYKLIAPLGRGGFGEVWKAEAPGGVLKAIKLVHGSLRSGHGEEVLVQQELKALQCVKGVRHPYILGLDRFDIIDGQLIMVMELADQSLWDRFQEYVRQGQTGIPREELLRYLEETAEALDLMNIKYRLQHSDIKPQNLFLIHNHVKVADFGLVKDLKGMKALTSGCFSPLYSAPETFEGWVSPHSDQYSLAIVYQELLTGKRPFDGKNARQLLMQHMQQPPDLTPLPPADRETIGRALAKKPDQRFPSCMDLVQALRKGSATAEKLTPETPTAARPLVNAPSVLEGAASARDYHLTFATRCPTCNFTGRVPKKFKGKPVKCRGCGHIFPAEPVTAPPEAEVAAIRTTKMDPPRNLPGTDVPIPKAPPVPPPSLAAVPATVDRGQLGLEDPPPLSTAHQTVTARTAVKEAPPLPAPVTTAVQAAALAAAAVPGVECPVCGHHRHEPIANQTGSLRCLQCGCVHASKSNPALLPAPAPAAALAAPRGVAVECPVCGHRERVAVDQQGQSIRCRQCGCAHRVG